MIVNELLNPKSIAVIGASNDVEKPGGKVLLNLIGGHFKGKLFTVNPKERIVQGNECHQTIDSLPETDLAIIAIAAKYIPETMQKLASEKNTKAFIVLSAGFSEVGPEGKALEAQLVEIVKKVNGTLIGPNCIGMLTTSYQGVFAGPVPILDSNGCDCVSGSGATMCFILEAAIPRGLTFSSIFSVGNSAQIGVEDVLEFWDETYNPETSSKIKLLYMEKIDNAQRLLKHASSLIKKDCKIAAIKAGTTEAGSRAVSSHTGALSGSDVAVDALFKKAGIIRCCNRNELVDTAVVFSCKELKGDRLAVITHAGGPGVMLTDTLSKGGMKVPHIQGKEADELLSVLFAGSSVANPIDILATGTASQFGTVLDYTDKKFDNIDGSAVIFGTSGLFDVTDAYDVLNDKINKSEKPIFPVLPSVILAAKEMEHFREFGKAFFTDEAALGRTISKVFKRPKPAQDFQMPETDFSEIRKVIARAENSYLSPAEIHVLLDSVGISRAKEETAQSSDEAIHHAKNLGFPLVMKVVGPIHKSDVGGVVLNINSEEEVKLNYNKIMKIEGAQSVLLQQMLSGTELFAGVSFEPKFGHIILCGLGGIFIEVLKDVASGLAPLTKTEALEMIASLKGAKLFDGVRGKKGINKELFADVIFKLSILLQIAPEIKELDLNPLLGTAEKVIAVDSRIRIEK